MASVASGKASEPGSADRLLKLALILGIVLVAFLAIISAEMFALGSRCANLAQRCRTAPPLSAALMPSARIWIECSPICIR